MEGQCKERPGVEGTEGGRWERLEQVVTTPILRADSESRHSDRTKEKYADIFFCMTCVAEY